MKRSRQILQVQLVSHTWIPSFIFTTSNFTLEVSNTLEKLRIILAFTFDEIRSYTFAYKNKLMMGNGKINLFLN